MKSVHYEYGLTAREFEVLNYMTEGLSNPEIANKIFVSECTVKAHVGHILEKMRVQNRILAIIKAIKEDIV